MLSHPSSLQSHSDFPTPITPILPASPNLIGAYHRWSPVETLGSQVLPPLSFTACRWPYPGSPAGAHTLCFPASTGLPPITRRSASSPSTTDLSLTRTLPATSVRFAVTRLHHSLYATACGFGWHPWLGKTRIVCEPSRYHVGASSAVCYHACPPSAYISKRAIDMTTSFHVVR